MLCNATTKAGEPCSRGALEGYDTCMAHAPAEVRASKGFVADNGKGGRPPRPRAVDVIRERLEADLDAILKPLQGLAESAESEAVRLAAMREILDRAYGKPRQGTDVEISGSLSLNVLDLAATLEEPADAEDAA